MSKNQVNLENAIFECDLTAVTALMKKPDLIRFVASDPHVWDVWAQHSKGRADILETLLSGGPPYDWMTVVEAAINNHSADGLTALLNQLPKAGADKAKSVWSMAATASQAEQPQAMAALGVELQRLLNDKRPSSCAEAAAVIRVIEAAFPGSTRASLENPAVLAARIRTACVGDTKTSPDMADLLTNHVAETTSIIWAEAFHRLMATHPQGVRVGDNLFSFRKNPHTIDRLMTIVGCCPQAKEGWDLLWNHRATWEQGLDTVGLEAQHTQEDIIAWVAAGHWGKSTKKRPADEIEKSLSGCDALAQALGCPLGHVAHANSYVLNAHHSTQSLMDVVLMEAGGLVSRLLKEPNGETELLASLNRPFIMRYACARIAMLPYEELMTTYPSLGSWRDDYGNSWAHHLAAAYYTGAKDIEKALSVRPELLLVRNNAGNTPAAILAAHGTLTPSLDRLCRLVQMTDDQRVLHTATAETGPHKPGSALKM